MTLHELMPFPVPDEMTRCLDCDRFIDSDAIEDYGVCNYKKMNDATMWLYICQRCWPRHTQQTWHNNGRCATHKVPNYATA